MCIAFSLSIFRCRFFLLISLYLFLWYIFYASFRMVWLSRRLGHSAGTSAIRRNVFVSGLRQSGGSPACPARSVGWSVHWFLSLLLRPFSGDLQRTRWLQSAFHLTRNAGRNASVNSKSVGFFLNINTLLFIFLDCSEFWIFFKYLKLIIVVVKQ